MIARDWILDVLTKLELRYWPVFLWQLWWLDRYMKARRAEHSSGLIGYSVCARGRIYITLQAFGDKPDPNDWTRFAPRAPWEKLAPGCEVEGLQLSGLEPIRARLATVSLGRDPCSIVRVSELDLHPP